MFIFQFFAILIEASIIRAAFNNKEAFETIDASAIRVALTDIRDFTDILDFTDIGDFTDIRDFTVIRHLSLNFLEVRALFQIFA